MRLDRLLSLARDHRAGLLLIALLTLAESLAWLALPALAGRMMGEILDATGGALGPLVMLIVLGLVAATGLRAAMGVLSVRITSEILAGLRMRMHDHIQSLPVAVHHRHTLGDLLALQTWEIGQLGRFLTGTLVILPAQALTAVGSIVLMWRIDPALALIVPVLVPAFYIVLRIVGRHLRRLGQELQEAEAIVVDAASESLAMLPAIKAFTREGATSRRFAKRVAAARDLAVRGNTTYEILGSSLGLATGLGAILLLVLAGQSLRNGAMTSAELVSFLLYAALLTRPVSQLALVYGQTQSTRGILRRLSAVLDTAPEPGRDGPQRLARARGAISLDGVVFAHEGREPVLRDVSLAIRPGETVAITGPNGAGKSTLVSLLLRFTDPQAGTVRLDGVDVREIRLEDLRRQIGLVPQRPLLFDGTIRENIGFGREEASDAEIEAAARLAQAHDFALALPEGYDTRVGENGVRLSGGQGQRIALARALLKDPPILVLDEATSMYDLDGEGAFVAEAASRLAGRTVILITHRPATLTLADRTIRLEAGRIVEELSAA